MVSQWLIYWKENNIVNVTPRQDPVDAITDEDNGELLPSKTMKNYYRPRQTKIKIELTYIKYESKANTFEKGNQQLVTLIQM